MSKGSSALSHYNRRHSSPYTRSTPDSFQSHRTCPSVQHSHSSHESINHHMLRTMSNNPQRVDHTASHRLCPTKGLSRQAAVDIHRNTEYSQIVEAPTNRSNCKELSVSQGQYHIPCRRRAPDTIMGSLATTSSSVSVGLDCQLLDDASIASASVVRCSHHSSFPDHDQYCGATNSSHVNTNLLNSNERGNVEPHEGHLPGYSMGLTTGRNRKHRIRRNSCQGGHGGDVIFPMRFGNDSVVHRQVLGNQFSEDLCFMSQLRIPDAPGNTLLGTGEREPCSHDLYSGEQSTRSSNKGLVRPDPFSRSVSDIPSSDTIRISTRDCSSRRYDVANETAREPFGSASMVTPCYADSGVSVTSIEARESVAGASLYRRELPVVSLKPSCHARPKKASRPSSSSSNEVNRFPRGALSPHSPEQNPCASVAIHNPLSRDSDGCAAGSRGGSSTSVGGVLSSSATTTAAAIDGYLPARCTQLDQRCQTEGRAEFNREHFLLALQHQQQYQTLAQLELQRSCQYEQHSAEPGCEGLRVLPSVDAVASDRVPQRAVVGFLYVGEGQSVQIERKTILQQLSVFLHKSIISKIDHSSKFLDDVYEYRFVILPRFHPWLSLDMDDQLRQPLMDEVEWRMLGIGHTRGWEHYGYCRHESNVFLFRRPLGTDSKTGQMKQSQKSKVQQRKESVDRLQKKLDASLQSNAAFTAGPSSFSSRRNKSSRSNCQRSPSELIPRIPVFGCSHGRSAAIDYSSLIQQYRQSLPSNYSVNGNDSLVTSLIIARYLSAVIRTSAVRRPPPTPFFNLADLTEDEMYDQGNDSCSILCQGKETSHMVVNVTCSEETGGDEPDFRIADIEERVLNDIDWLFASIHMPLYTTY